MVGGGIHKAFVQPITKNLRSISTTTSGGTAAASFKKTTATSGSSSSGGGGSFFSARTAATDSASPATSTLHSTSDVSASAHSADASAGVGKGHEKEARQQLEGAEEEEEAAAAAARAATVGRSRRGRGKAAPFVPSGMLTQEARAAAAVARPSSVGDGSLNKNGKKEHRRKKKDEDWRWTGRLVARILPRRYEEYDLRKPRWQFDPAELEGGRVRHVQQRPASATSGGIGSGGRSNGGSERVDGGVYSERASTLERRGSEGICDDVLMLAPLNDDDGRPYDLSGRRDDDMVIALDLFLFRRSVPSFVPLSRSMHGDSVGSTGCSSERSGGSSRLGCPDAASSSSSTSLSSSSSDEEEEGWDGTILDMHMKRDATEAAPRTLRRLEISTAKKLQAENPRYGYGKRCHKKSTPSIKANMAKRNRETSSAVVVKPRAEDAWDEGWIDDNVVEAVGGDVVGDGERQKQRLTEIDPTGLTSADLWRTVAAEYDVHPDTRGRVGISLLNPNAAHPSGSGAASADERILVDVVSCPPTILKVQTFEDFEAQVFTGVPLVVETDLIYASHAVVTWYVEGNLVLHDSKIFTPTEADIGKTVSVLIVPTRPGHDGRGCEEAYRFKHEVATLPFMPIVSPIRDAWRHRRTPEEKDDLRILTYNILADLYTSRDIDQHLMYAHCNLRHLMRWRRMPMLIYEILAYHADVICLQEVDDVVYETLLRPVLSVNRYQGFYSNKASTQREGCAMFWSTDCFEAAREGDMQTVSIRDLFGEHELRGGGGGAGASGGYESAAGDDDEESKKLLSKWDSMGEIIDLMGKHDELRRVTQEKTGQILQVATLTLKKPREDDAANKNLSNKPDKMVLANTHLFYHPMADHIRAMQAYVVCKKIDEVRRRDCRAHVDPYPLVFCGDLNSDPLSGAVQLLFTRAVLPEHHETWKHLHDYCWEMGDNEYMIEHGYVGNDETVVEPVYIEEAFDDAHEDESSLAEDSFGDNSTVHPPPIVLPASFPNLVSGCPDMPEFTNYAVDFVETLDYVLASEPSGQERYGFGPKKAAPMPSEEEVKRYVAMPNEFMPSDHVSVVCDLEWKTNDEA